MCQIWETTVQTINSAIPQVNVQFQTATKMGKSDCKYKGDQTTEIHRGKGEENQVEAKFIG